MSTEPNKIIYSMVGVSKYYDKRAVLKDIYLSYFYGAKIGVIGLNGSGKSSLLRILAGSVQADDADLRAVKVGEVDVLEDLLLSMELGDTDHGIDDFVGFGLGHGEGG